jgi:hypothetical protein
MSLLFRAGEVKDQCWLGYKPVESDFLWDEAEAESEMELVNSREGGSRHNTRR